MCDEKWSLRTVGKLRQYKEQPLLPTAEQVE